MNFIVSAKGRFAVLRTYSVESKDGFIAGGFPQYVPHNEKPLPFIDHKSFSKVEAQRLADDLNLEFKGKSPNKGEIDSFLWGEQHDYL